MGAGLGGARTTGPALAPGGQPQLRVLSKVTQAFSEASQSPEQLFDVIVREIAETLHCTCALSLATADGIGFTTCHPHAPDPASPPELRTVVPVILRGSVIGALTLSRHGDHAQPLDEHDLSLAQTLAEHASLAIAAARLIEDSKRELVERNRMAARLDLLAKASHAFSEATGDYDRLLDVIASHLAQVIGDLCAVGAVSEDGTVLEAGSVHHSDPEIVALARRLLLAHPIPVGEGVSGRVAASGEPLFVPRVALADLVASALPEYRELLERVNVGSLIIVPMMCRGKVAGVATMFRSGSHNPYTEDDLRLARSVADHAALAIANARSYAAERVARAAAVTAHQALQESEAAHRLLFEASPLPVLVLDVATLKCLAVNEAALRLYGYSRDEFLQMDLSSLRVGSDRDAVMASMAAMRADEVTGQVRHRRKAGPSFLAEYASRALTFGGRPARITVVTDVTARHDADEMRALLAAIVQSSNDAIVSSQLDGTITSWNTAAQNLFGYSAGKAIGQPIFLVVPADRIDEERALLARVAAGERIDHHDTVRMRGDRSEFPVSISLSPITDSSGKVCGVAETARDLTAQRQAEQALLRAEEQLRQAQKMEAVGRLAGGIAHDFNNLLSVVLGYSQLLVGEAKAAGETPEGLEEIHAAALRASELTRQLLVFSRQEVVAPKVIDLNQVLARVDKLVRRIVGEDIELLSLPAPDLALVLADPNSVEQVIMNLVVNARDAMPTGGRLTIETGNVELDEHYAREHLGATAGAHVMLAVHDTGTGMDKATRARIFEPFFTTKEVGKGTGLGLSTVFGIVQEARGSVSVSSEPGHGATFKAFFPCVQSACDVAAPKRAPVNLAGSETILLVEDQEQVRGVAHGILRRYGYCVVVAQDAAQALTLAEQHRERIHLLLTDVVMPKMSGSELAKRLALSRPDTKVLFMSGYTDDSVVRHGVSEKGTPFLQKPFTPESMARRLRDVLDS